MKDLRIEKAAERLKVVSVALHGAAEDMELLADLLAGICQEQEAAEQGTLFAPQATEEAPEAKVEKETISDSALFERAGIMRSPYHAYKTSLLKAAARKLGVKIKRAKGHYTIPYAAADKMAEEMRKLNEGR